MLTPSGTGTTSAVSTILQRSHSHVSGITASRYPGLALVGTADGGQRCRLRAAQPPGLELMTTASHWIVELHAPSARVEVHILGATFVVTVRPLSRRHRGIDAGYGYRAVPAMDRRVVGRRTRRGRTGLGR